MSQKLFELHKLKETKTVEKKTENNNNNNNSNIKNKTTITTTTATTTTTTKVRSDEQDIVASYNICSGIWMVGLWRDECI